MLRHERVHKTPANGGIENFILALESAGGFAHHERRAGHGLHATGNHQVAITGADSAGGKAQRIQTGTAEAVQGGAGNGLWQPGQQEGHPRHVAVVFPRLVRAAKNHVINTFRIQTRITQQ